LYHLENLSPFQDILTKTAFISPPVEAGVFCGDRIKKPRSDGKPSLCGFLFCHKKKWDPDVPEY